MFWAKLGCVFGFILNCSGVLGGVSSICALKGSSVALPCSAQDPNIIKKWYKLEHGHWKAISADVKQVTYNTVNKNHPTLSLTDLTKNDSGNYCCGNLTDQSECSPPYLKIHLTVTGLQVQVIPTTEGQTATLVCRTSCYLTKKPVVYIWYRNREVLYQDWSPWYQEMVTSEQATRYSCAIKDYEHLRTPEVSVDSVTSTCFSVTYSEGAMCLYNQTSMNEPCSITYPRDIFVQSHLGAKDHFRLTCNTSCPPTNIVWYKSRQQQDQIPRSIPKTSADSFSCAVKGVKDLLHSAEVCVHGNNCFTLNYTSRRICALEGSSVNISSVYSFPFQVEPYSKSWYKKKQNYEEKDETLTEAAGRVEYHDNMKNQHTLTIKNVEKNDSAEYRFRLLDDTSKIGVTLTVTGLQVTFTPSAVVTEGQRVTLTCSTSCPLTDNKNYIWYFNNQPLMQPENQNKRLVLDPVRTEHRGNYSCTVNTHKHTRSLENTLTIQSLTTTWTLAAAAKFCGAILLLIIIIIILISVFCCIRGKPRSSQTLGYETSHMLEEVNTCHVYNEISPQPAEENDVYYSSVSYENYTHSPHFTAQSPQDHVPYSVVGLKINAH